MRPVGTALRQPCLKSLGAGGRNRTGMVLPPADFESAASTNFATPASVKGWVGLKGRELCHRVLGGRFEARRIAPNLAQKAGC
jgi:hypothetical protein